MKRLLVSQEQAKKIAAKLPDGKAIGDIRFVRCSAKIIEEPTTGNEDAALLASIEMAGAPPLLTNGKPTIMRVVAWVLHEGVNKNRLEFLAEDLGPTADAIRVPNVLPMDFNHSAFRPFSTDPKTIGVWYRAEKRWDPHAKDGKGAYGIIAEGIIWSWLYPDYATELLAEQQRNGRIDFSMACLPTSSEYATDADGPKEIAHQPVLLTHSALDVPPADADAVGIGVEGSDDPNLEQTLLEKLATSLPSPTPNSDPAVLPLAAALSTPVDQLTEVQMEELQAQIDALTAKIASLTATEEQLAAAQAQLATLAGEMEALRGQLVESETARTALVDAAATTASEMDTLRAALETAQAQLAEINDAAAAAARAEAYEARIAALPEPYRVALSKRTQDEQDRFATKWAAASDEEWNEFATEIQFAFQNVRVSYLDRSHAEGGALPNGGSEQDDIASLVGSIKR